MKLMTIQLMEILKKLMSSQEDLIIFLAGGLCGLLLVIVLCIFFRILLLLCRRDKKVPWIELETEHGAVFVSAAAVSDLVHTVSGRHPALETEKALLIRKQNQLVLQVKACYCSEENISLSECSKAFQDDVLATLEKTMGITAVEKVLLTIPRCRS